MCLITKQSEPEITTEEMQTVKIVSINPSLPGYAIASYNWFEYILNKPYRTEIKISKEPKPFNILVQDYYKYNKSYQRIVGQSGVTAIMDEEPLFAYGNGFHSIIKDSDQHRFIKERIEHGIIPSFHTVVICTIPAGSEIYKDATGLIVSNNIIVTDKIDYAKRKRLNKWDIHKGIKN